MTNAPEQLLKMVEEAVEAHPEDIEDALNVLVNQWARHPARRTWAEELETRALREMIHRYRHKVMTQLRRMHGAYGTPAKVTLSTGASARASELMILDSYSINGHVLGSILGEDLLKLAEGEDEKSAGCAFNANLCRALARKVPKNRLVRDAVSEKVVRRIFAELGQNAEQAA
jgi:hypothetical protein